MIVYHGGPFSDTRIAAEVYRHRHAMVSFARPEQLELVADICATFALDCGAFTAWRSGNPIRNWDLYYRFVETWRHHPSCNLVLIPDVIDGEETDNDDLLADWPFDDCGTPVWHLHESLERLQRLARSFVRIALGSSGPYRTPGTLLWWDRMRQVMQVLCDDHGYPTVKLHGLRMLAPDILVSFPLASADSTAVCRNINLDTKWRGTYQPATRLGRALLLRDRVESFVVTRRWKEPGSNSASETASHQLALGLTH
jgi:hypothetical protein